MATPVWTGYANLLPIDTALAQCTAPTDDLLRRLCTDTLYILSPPTYVQHRVCAFIIGFDEMDRDGIDRS